MGYWVGESFWGNGIASESVELIINYAFSVLKLEEVYAHVYSQNNRSIRVLEKNIARSTTDIIIPPNLL